MLAPEPSATETKQMSRSLSYETLSPAEAKEAIRRKNERQMAVVLWIGFALFAFVAGMWTIVHVIGPFLAHERTVKAKERQLLYQTDSQKLLAACREICDKKLTGGPTNPAMPAIIRSLKPNYVGVGDNEVDLEFGGGFFHYGVTAFRPGVRGAGTKEIIPGLWFYAENGKVPSP